MASPIIKIKDKYFVWCTIVDAPKTKGMNVDELKEYIREEQGDAGVNELPYRLERVDQKGTSDFSDNSMEDTIRYNRASQYNNQLTANEIYEQYS